MDFLPRSPLAPPPHCCPWIFQQPRTMRYWRGGGRPQIKWTHEKISPSSLTQTRWHHGGINQLEKINAYKTKRIKTQKTKLFLEQPRNICEVLQGCSSTVLRGLWCLQRWRQLKEPLIFLWGAFNVKSWRRGNLWRRQKHLETWINTISMLLFFVQLELLGIVWNGKSYILWCWFLLFFSCYLRPSEAVFFFF